MITREKIIYLKENGVSISHIARLVKCSPSTLTNWMKGYTELSERLNEDVENAIKEWVNKVGKVVEE